MDYKPHPGYELLITDPDKAMSAMTRTTFPPELEVVNRTVPGPAGAPDVRVRVYRRKGAKNAPLVLDFHPGGFTMGGLDMCDARGAFFALEVPCVVVAVDYRLAPENQYPAQLRDCEAVLGYVLENPGQFGVDGARVALCGTSAGGNLATGLCLWLRDTGGPDIALQILNYPVTRADATTPSAMMIGEDLVMTRASTLRGTMENYIGPTNGWPVPYYALPGTAPDLTGLPPAFVVVCEYDTLRDEGIDYARALMAAAVPCELYSMPRVPHAYDDFPGELTDWIRRGMAMALRREFGILK